METMHIEVLSLIPANDDGRVRARARVAAPAVAARLWIEIRFEPTSKDVWAEAYDRTLRLLDPA